MVRGGPSNPNGMPTGGAAERSVRDTTASNDRLQPALDVACAQFGWIDRFDRPGHRGCLTSSLTGT